ncbi:MAG: hypothetical protein IJX96_02220 [Clostridia bacterium]|nr:hypothetical protein [Clostridia bacterium]
MQIYHFPVGVRAEVDFERGVIHQITKNGQSLIFGEVPFFAVKMRTKKGEKRVVSGAECRFSGFEQGAAVYAHKDFDACVRVRAEENALVWGIAVKNKTQDLLEWVELPSLGVKEKLRDEENGVGEIVYPFNEGCIVSNMQKRENFPFRYLEPEYPSYGKYSIFPNMISSQFLAYIANGLGVYLGLHDPERTTKHIDFRYDKDCIKLQTRTFCNADYGQDYEMPFPCVMQFFEGDYYSACEIYRAWFETHLPKNLKKIKDAPDLPKWYSESPIVVAYPVRGKFDTDTMTPNGLYPYENALPILKDLSGQTQSRVMPILMHWEGTAPWAPPYMWPPFGGEEQFCAFVQKAHAENMLVGLYCSGMGWTQQSHLIAEYNREADFIREDIKSIVCSDSNGEISSTICTAQRRGYDLCPACERAKTLFVSEIEKLVNSGVDYVQAMDQNHGGNSYFCYSSAHGHTPAPGKWQAEETLKMLDRIEKGNVLLGCESAAGEPLLSALRFSDNRFELNYYLGLPAPLYGYIYHEYANNFMGNQICHMLSHEEYDYSYRVAHSFICGDMLTAVIDDQGNIAYAWGSSCFKNHTDKATAVAILKNLNAWRQKGGKEFLHTGRMIPPMKITAEGKNTFVLEDGSILEVEKALYSAFEYEGEKRQFVVNYNLQPLQVKFEAAATVYETPDLSSVKAGLNEYQIPPLSAIMLKI